MTLEVKQPLIGHESITDLLQSCIPAECTRGSSSSILPAASGIVESTTLSQAHADDQHDCYWLPLHFCVVTNIKYITAPLHMFFTKHTLCCVHCTPAVSPSAALMVASHAHITCYQQPVAHCKGLAKLRTRAGRFWLHTCASQHPSEAQRRVL